MPAPRRPGPARARAGRARLAHPAAVGSQQTAPRQLPGLPHPARHPRPPPATPAPAWPTAAGATASAPPPPTPPASPPGGAASPPRCPASPRAPPAWSSSTSTPTAASSRPDLATGLLPGIDLAAEPIPASQWDDPARYRDGRDTLHPAGPAPRRPPPLAARPRASAGHRRHARPAAPTCGTRHPLDGLRQALSDPHGRYGLAWQVDLKAGWSYGVAPGAATSKGTYQHHAAATPPGPAACPPGSPARSSGASPRPARRLAGPLHVAARRAAARPPTWPPSSAAVPLARRHDRRPPTRPVRPGLPRRRAPRLVRRRRAAR